MNLKRVPPKVLARCAEWLSDYIPITAAGLASALSAFDPETTKSTNAQSLPGQLITTKQAAARINVSLPTVFKLLREGKLTRVRLGKRKTLIPENDVIKLGGNGL